MSHSSPPRTAWGAVRVVVLLFALATLGACMVPEPAPDASVAAARPSPTAGQGPGKARPNGTPATTSKPRSAATAGSSARPQPVLGLTMPTPPANEGLSTVGFDRLPAQAQDVIRLIAKGGPFPYRQDGITFENRERVLPQRAAGYYKEYTVETPGSSDRGARRIVAGKQGELYYTDDHYATFRRIIP